MTRPNGVRRKRQKGHVRETSGPSICLGDERPCANCGGLRKGHVIGGV